MQSLDDALIRAAVDDETARGKTVTCRAGCGACCRQLAPISQIEARYLAEEPQMLAPEMFGNFLAQFARPTKLSDVDP